MYMFYSLQAMNLFPFTQIFSFSITDKTFTDLTE